MKSLTLLLGTLSGIIVAGLRDSSAQPEPAQTANSLSAVRDENGIKFHSGKTLIGHYVTAPTVAKPYLWPIYAPGEIPVTRPWPMEAAKPGGTTDHVHQKSVWFCHGEVIPEGIEPAVDFWTENKGKDGKALYGKIVCTDVGELRVISKSEVAVLTKNEWRTPTGVKIMDEEANAEGPRSRRG